MTPLPRKTITEYRIQSFGLLDALGVFGITNKRALLFAVTRSQRARDMKTGRENRKRPCRKSSKRCKNRGMLSLSRSSDDSRSRWTESTRTWQRPVERRWEAVERRAARRAARRKTDTARSVLYMMRQRTLAAAAPASAGDVRRPTQRKQAPQRRRSRAVCAHTGAKGANARSAGARASASTSSGANARSAGAGASASTSAKGADARSAGGADICQHQRIRSECKECGGASICQHQRIRGQCKECGGAGICQHQRERSQCKECGAGEQLPAPAPKEPMQGVRGGGHLPAPAPQERMQGVRGREHLPAPAPQERMQRVPR
jgi:hypothetical protein